MPSSQNETDKEENILVPEANMDKESVNEEEEETEYSDDEYEYQGDDDDDVGDATSVEFLVDNPDQIIAQSREQKSTTEKAFAMSVQMDQQKTSGKKRLAHDLYRIMNLDASETGFCITPAQEDRFDIWNIELSGFDEDSHLSKDLHVLGLDAIKLQMSFPDEYPFQPPFVQVKSPRFARNTGYVIKGALCMELLTADGWNPINDIETVIVSIRSLLVEGKGRLEQAQQMDAKKYDDLLKAPSPKPCSTSSSTTTTAALEYSSKEARDAHKYLTDIHVNHGWSDHLVRKG